MICNKCQQDLPETKFIIKYYRKDGSPYRRPTCEICRGKFTEEKKETRRATRKKRYDQYRNPRKPKQKIKKDLTLYQIFFNRILNRSYGLKKDYGIIIDTRAIDEKSMLIILRKQHNKCGICKEFLDTTDPKKYQIDHIVPFCLGGLHEQSNVQFLCSKCHRSKSGYEGKEIQMIKRLDNNG